MYAFAYWHAYYDSAFLHYPLKISPALFRDLNITCSSISQWPTLPELPSLPKIFDLLEQFILDDRNWMGCNCNEQQMETIQQELNSIMIYLQCEKKYGAQFWLKNSRRIQASVVHFFLFLKMTVFTIIPEECQTLLQAGRGEKLSIEMVKLETLINDILSLLEPLHNFMFQSQFSEQIQLTKTLFAEISVFMQTLPTLSRTKILKVPKLMEYICLCNPLQTQNINRKHEISSIRKRNTTLHQRPRQSLQITSQDKHKRRKKMMAANSIIRRKQKQSLEKIKTNDCLHNSKDIMKELQFFRFNEKVRKQTIYANSKKPTVASLQTKEKTSSFDISRSPSLDRSTAIGFQVNRIQSRTVTDQSPTKKSSVDRRSRNVSSKSIQSKNSIAFKKNCINQKQEVEHERLQKTSKKKTNHPPLIRTIQYSQLQLLSEGKSKGWGIIREYLFHKIAQRKLNKLILL